MDITGKGKNAKTLQMDYLFICCLMNPQLNLTVFNMGVTP